MAFAVRRPPPASARDRFGGGSESEEEGEGRSEAITSFDGRRGTSSSQKGKSGLGSGITQSGKPLVIPSQKNKDWKAEAARLKALKNGAQRYRPGLADESSGAQKKNVTEQDLKDASKIESNSAGGLAPMKRSVPPTVEAGDKFPEGPSELSSTSPLASSLKPIDADEAAYRALLKEASGVPEDTEPADIEAIHGDTQNNFWDRQNNRPMGEEDLFRADVDARPDSATMQDYERVPVEAFGAALLRGMYASGSNTRQTPVEPYVPKARPNLLGIGAKELDLGEDKNSRSTRDKERQRKKESMHFVPLLKKEKSAASTEDRPMLPPPIPSKRDREDRKQSSSSRKRHDSPPSKSSRTSSSRREYDDDHRYYSSSSINYHRQRDYGQDDYDSKSRRRSRSPPRDKRSSRDKYAGSDRDRSSDKDRRHRDGGDRGASRSSSRRDDY